jgi:hypothetical protein
MKKSLSYSLVLLLGAMAVSFAEPDKAAMEAREKAAWQAYKDKNRDDFRKVVDKDIWCVYSDGVSNLAKELYDMKKWDIKSFEISNFGMFTDEKDVMVTTYSVKLDATANGKDVSGNYYAGTVWKEEDGQWLAIFHTSVKQEK